MVCTVCVHACPCNSVCGSVGALKCWSPYCPYADVLSVLMPLVFVKDVNFSL